MTHDQVEAMTMATRIAVLNKGVIQQVGSPQDLYERPRDIFVAGFIGSPAMNFFPVTVVGDLGELALDAGGFRLPVPAGRTRTLAPYRGRRVVLGVRPEHIYDREFAPPGIHGAPMPAMVDVVEKMGSEAFLYLVNGGKPFLARVDPRTRARPGQTVEVVLDLDYLHLFDPETEEALS